MELKIIEDKKNDLLKRREIVAEFNEKTVPSRQVFRQKISALVDVPIDQVVIQKVDSRFGTQKGKVFGKVYSSPEVLKVTERKFVRERNFGKEKKAVAEGPEAPPANFKK